MSDLLQYIPANSDGLEVNVTATVGEHFLNEVIVGWSCARIYNATVRIHFFGGSPQVFKTGMPLDLNLVASFHDGSPLRAEQLRGAQLTVRTDIEMKSGGRRTLDNQFLRVSPENNAVWSMRVNCIIQSILAKYNYRHLY